MSTRRYVPPSYKDTYSKQYLRYSPHNFYDPTTFLPVLKSGAGTLGTSPVLPAGSVFFPIRMSGIVKIVVGISVSEDISMKVW